MSMGRSIFVAPQTCMVRALKYSWIKKFRIPTMKGHGTMPYLPIPVETLGLEVY